MEQKRPEDCMPAKPEEAIIVTLGDAEFRNDYETRT